VDGHSRRHVDLPLWNEFDLQIQNSARGFKRDAQYAKRYRVSMTSFLFAPDTQGCVTVVPGNIGSSSTVIV
jgi:hypothetical protein